MTDRYYPPFPGSADGVWQSTYELQNEMRTFQRSAYPPGYAGHEPGARDKFGFSTPGPDAWKLSHSELALTEEAELHEGRRIHALTRVPVADDRETFHKHDLPAAEKSGRSPWASPDSSPTKSMSRTQSLPSIQRKPPPPSLRKANPSIDKFEDQRFSYFVPSHMQTLGKKKLSDNRPSLSRIEKADRVVLNLDGTGTGFKTQCDTIGWDPSAQKAPAPKCASNTSYKVSFSRPPFYRMSHSDSFRRSFTRTC